MKPQLDSARKAFQEDLGLRASRKRIRALAAANREAKAPEEKPEKASVVGLLKEINAAEAAAALAIRVSSAVNTIPHTQPVWFIPLNAADTGLRNITIFNLSAANSGFVDRMIAHPIAILPGVGVANQPVILDGINSAFNLERIYDGAALSLLEWFKGATTATTYNGYICVVSG